MFTAKSDKSLWLYVDYRGSNSMAIKNQYPLPLIDKILDRLSDAPVFIKIDVKNTYYRFRIQQSNEWKTAFRTRYGLFEYLVMSFGLTNATASFQSFINRVLRFYLDIIVIVHLDDVLVFLINPSLHEKHIRDGLKAPS